MGASGWVYFVPHREDVEKALQDLRDQIFRTGQYRKWPTVTGTTIAEVLAQSGENGTLSILDIERVSLVPALQAVSPLSPERLQEVFETDKPTRQMVEDIIDEDELEELNPKWQGIYIPVYESGKPDALCFVGSSGD